MVHMLANLGRYESACAKIIACIEFDTLCLLSVSRVSNNLYHFQHQGKITVIRAILLSTIVLLQYTSRISVEDWHNGTYP